MDELLLKLQNATIVKLQKGGDLDLPYMCNGNKTYTKREIINEINLSTDFSKKFISNLVLLSLDLFDREIEKIEGFEKI